MPAEIALALNCAEQAVSFDGRDAMAHAAYQAGQAINQVNVGNVHAIAHQLGAIYGIPHGLANAYVLPHVLDLSLERARGRLTELAQLIGRQTAEDFIAAVRELNSSLGIGDSVDKLQTKDFHPHPSDDAHETA